MTQQEIDSIARKYCKLLGLDPDKEIVGNDPQCPEGTRVAPMWWWQVSRVKQALALRLAIDSVLPASVTLAPGTVGREHLAPDLAQPVTACTTASPSSTH
ncbi:hypothetical protein [Methylobacterium sp. WSM2598]|uniref:hypothetical protein n=1 Tax=Methylobacterium sp. WSM2598 TaxID=398261 RepID=UPI00035E928C|nr:hypothetical protein [Methylobacterium sp. WSM2598]